MHTVHLVLIARVVCQDGLVQNRPHSKTMNKPDVAAALAVVDPDQSAGKRKFLALSGFVQRRSITLRYLHPAFGRNCQGSMDSSSSILVPLPSSDVFKFSFEFDTIDEPSCKRTRRFVLFSSSWKETNRYGHDFLFVLTSFCCSFFAASRSWAFSKTAPPEEFSARDHRSASGRFRWFFPCFSVPDREFFERRRPECGCCWDENTFPGDNRSSIDCGMDDDGDNDKLCTTGDNGVVGEVNNCFSLSFWREKKRNFQSEEDE